MTREHPTTLAGNKNDSRVYAFLICLALSIPLIPNSWATSLDPTTSSDTAVSGYPGIGSESFILRFSDGLGITEIDWEELSDKPCMLRLTGKDPGNASDTRSSVNDICGGLSRIDSHKDVRFKDSPRYFVRGISVCTNNKDNHRLKGIKIVAAKLPAGNSRVDALTVTNQATHTNCANWHATVFCDTDKVASGLNVKVKDAAVVGLGLQCQRRQ